MEEKEKRGKWKGIIIVLLLLMVGYLGAHIYFIWQPAGKPAEWNQRVIDANVAGVELFPVIQSYDLEKIDARAEIRAKQKLKASPIIKRLEYAIDRNAPITFKESEINIWLRKRLNAEQGGLFGKYVKVKGVWVDLTPDEVELILERELPDGSSHVVSLFMRFESSRNGFIVDRYAAHVGQVKMPGGFSRLVLPTFTKLADELSEELRVYKDDSLSSDQALKIHDVIVEEGLITLDPRSKTDMGM